MRQEAVAAGEEQLLSPDEREGRRSKESGKTVNKTAVSRDRATDDERMGGERGAAQ